MGQLAMLFEETGRGSCEWEQFAKVVTPVIDNSVRGLCVRKYRGHPRGCPNFGKRDTCPPKAPLLARVLDLNEPVHCVWNRFNLAAHVNNLNVAHPDWSLYQLRNCLYWQGTARKQLHRRISEMVKRLRFDPVILTCPEACGVNVTATMKSIGVELEWPPKQFAYQVALMGHPAERKGGDSDG